MCYSSPIIYQVFYPQPQSSLLGEVLYTEGDWCKSFAPISIMGLTSSVNKTAGGSDLISIFVREANLF